MACKILPFELPNIDLGGIGISAPLPSFTGGVDLCCKIKLFDFHPPFPLSFTVLEGAMAPIKAARDLVQSYMDALVFPCPRE